MTKHFRESLRRFSLSRAEAADLLGESIDTIERWCRDDTPVPAGTVPHMGRLAEEDFYRRVGGGPVAWTRRS